MTAPQVEFYPGKDDREAALWNSANILDHNLSNTTVSAQDYMPGVSWVDGEGRYCELSSEAAANPHYITSLKDRNKYGRTRYFLTRTEPENGPTFTFVLDTDRKRIEQRDKNHKALPFGQRIGEKVLLASILESYESYYDYSQVLKPYNGDFKGINEAEAFNEIVYHYDDQSSRLRRMGRKFRSFVGE